MLRPEMSMHAAAPPSHKGKVQCAADSRTRKRNQSPGPFFGRLSANLRGETFRNTRNKFFENLFLSQVLAVIDAGGSSCRFPHFNPLVLAASFETVEQREALDESESDHREQAGVRQERDHAAESEAGSLRKGQPFGIANQRRGNGVQPLGGYVFHPSKVRNPQAVLVGKVLPKVFRINFDRTKSAEHTKAQEALDGASCHRAFSRIV